MSKMSVIRHFQTPSLQLAEQLLTDSVAYAAVQVNSKYSWLRPRNHSFFPVNIDQNAPAKSRVSITSLSVFARAGDVPDTDQTLPVFGAQTLDDRSPRRFSVEIVAAFAMTALVLAALGICGVIFVCRQTAHARGRVRPDGVIRF